MTTSTFSLAPDLQLRVQQQPLELDGALDQIRTAIDTRRGAIFSSGFEFPGRHSRWDIGFIDPALEVRSSQNLVKIIALNEQGEFLLPAIKNALDAFKHLEKSTLTAKSLVCELRPWPKDFSEEERSRLPSLFSLLRQMQKLFFCAEPAASHFGLYGAFGYDLVLQFENIEQRFERNSFNASDETNCLLYLPLDLIVVDRKKEIATRIQYSLQTAAGSSDKHAAGGAQFSLPVFADKTAEHRTIKSDHLPGEFAEKVQAVIDGTKRGDYFEVVLSQEFSTEYHGTPSALFQRIAEVNPSPYMFLLNFGNEQLIGASPEMYVRVTGSRYETCPIAGTIRRGKDALEDAANAQTLLNSLKDESELTMCTDVDRNDMARVCVPGSVRVIGRRQLEFYSHLIHTVDHLEGELAPEFDALDAFQTHMWACTVTGAPKPAALQAIEDLEESPRRWYSGAVGFYSFQGNLTTGITLRTASLCQGVVKLRTGATLLHESVPEMEEEETRTKAAALLTALAQPENVLGHSVPKTSYPTGVLQRKILLVDCRDSFVHNLAAYLRELGCVVVTLRCGFSLELLEKHKPQLVLLSPGPGTPQEFGVPQLVGELRQRQLPIFGVCLGHQGIGQHFGATLSVLPTPVHGKVSLVEHLGTPLFTGVDKVFEAGRYHSLYLVHDTVPSELQVTAFTIRTEENGKEEKIPMAIEHRSLPIAAVQFHPESLMTLKNRAGHAILTNAIRALT